MNNNDEHQNGNEQNSSNPENGKAERKDDAGKGSHSETSSELKELQEEPPNNNDGGSIVEGDGTEQAHNKSSVHDSVDEDIRSVPSKEEVKLSHDSETGEMTPAQIKLSKESGKTSVHKWLNRDRGSAQGSSDLQEENNKLRSSDAGKSEDVSISDKRLSTPEGKDTSERKGSSVQEKSLSEESTPKQERLSPDRRVSSGEKSVSSDGKQESVNGKSSPLEENRSTSEEKRLPLDEKWSTPEEKSSALSEKWSISEEKRSTSNNESLEEKRFTQDENQLLSGGKQETTEGVRSSIDDNPPISSKKLSSLDETGQTSNQKRSTSEEKLKSPDEKRSPSAEKLSYGGKMSAEEKRSPSEEKLLYPEGQISLDGKRESPDEKQSPLVDITPHTGQVSPDEKWEGSEEKRSPSTEKLSFSDDPMPTIKKPSISEEDRESPDKKTSSLTENLSTGEETSTSDEKRESPVENRSSPMRQTEDDTPLVYNLDIPRVNTDEEKERLASSINNEQGKKKKEDNEDEEDSDESIVRLSDDLPEYSNLQSDHRFQYTDSLARSKKPKADYPTKESLLDDWPHSSATKPFYHPKGPKISQDQSEYLKTKLTHFGQRRSSSADIRKRYSELEHARTPPSSPDYENIVEAGGPTARAHRLQDARKDADIMSKQLQETAAKAMLDLLEIYKPLKTVSDKDRPKTVVSSELASRLKKLDREIKLTERRVAESKREQAYTLYQINELEMKLLRNEEEELIRTMMYKIPDAKDLDKIKSLKDIMMERRRVENNIRRLKIELTAINKVIADVDVILSESGIVKKRRKVVIYSGTEQEVLTSSKLVLSEPIEKESEEKRKSAEAPPVEIDANSLAPSINNYEEAPKASLEQQLPEQEENTPPKGESNNLNETN